MVGGATAMAGGVNGSNMTDPDRIWNEASVRLRAEIGDLSRSFGRLLDQHAQAIAADVKQRYERPLMEIFE